MDQTKSEKSTKKAKMLPPNFKKTNFFGAKGRGFNMPKNLVKPKVGRVTQHKG